MRNHGLITALMLSKTVYECHDSARVLRAKNFTCERRAVLGCDIKDAHYALAI
jgi:hypothetical protein